MDMTWQNKGGPANPADAADGPQVYDDHLYYNFGVRSYRFPFHRVRPALILGSRAGRGGPERGRVPDAPLPPQPHRGRPRARQRAGVVRRVVARDAVQRVRRVPQQVGRRAEADVRQGRGLDRALLVFCRRAGC